MPYARSIGVKFRETWRTKNFEKIICPYLKDGDSVLFIPAGRYRLPNTLLNVDCYYLDLDESLLTDVDPNHRFVCDMFEADEIINRKFDVVVADPPYTIPYNLRPKYTRTLRNLSKRVVIVKWNIIPRFGKNWELDEVYIYESKRWWTHASIISVFVNRDWSIGGGLRNESS